VGTVVLDGKPLKAVLVENDSDALFSKPVETISQARAANPVWLLLDVNGDDKLDARMGELFDVRGPFKIGEKTYESRISADGARVELTMTTKVALDLSPPARPALLAAGVQAPEFSAEKWGGGVTRLSNYKGKIVLLDFWATWCGPCRRSMPHLQKVYNAVKSQGVVVLALSVWENAKKDYEEWVPANRAAYSFDFAYDPAGGGAENIAKKLYNVSSIPTTYVIGKDGKVVAGIVGFSGDNDHRIGDALKGLGIRLP